MTKGNVHNEAALSKVLEHKVISPPPVWLMRQAGRYLPEYQKMRAKAGSFWTLCMTPELAVEVTLQPIRRFDFDAAILFSDILVVPYALGQSVRFEEGEGPVLEKIVGVEDLIRDEESWQEKLEPVYLAMRETRSLLAPERALIGFAGGPWTLAAYMLQGHGSPDQRAAKLFFYRDPAGFTTLLEILADAVAWHLIRQLDSGAGAVQIFDSWAGGLTEKAFADWVIAPNKRIVETIRKVYPKASIIGFPRAASQAGYERYVLETGIDAVGIDTATPMDWATAALGPRVAVQGNLDPIVLVAGGSALDEAIDGLLRATEKVPFIFNLGHGVLPETPLDHVARTVARVRGRT